jgi:hypothetical protein
MFRQSQSARSLLRKQERRCGRSVERSRMPSINWKRVEDRMRALEGRSPNGDRRSMISKEEMEKSSWRRRFHTTIVILAVVATLVGLGASLSAFILGVEYAQTPNLMRTAVFALGFAIFVLGLGYLETKLYGWTQSQ